MVLQCAGNKTLLEVGPVTADLINDVNPVHSLLVEGYNNIPLASM